MGAGVVIARYYGAKKETACKKAIHTTVAFDLWPVRADSFGNVSGTKDPIDGNSCGRAPGIYCVFPYIFCRVYGCCHVQFCWSSAVGRWWTPSIDISDYFFLCQCRSGYFFFIVSWHGESDQQHLQPANFTVCQCTALYGSSAACEEEYRLELRETRFDSSMLKQIIQNGVPSGFQNSVIAIANVFVTVKYKCIWKMAMAGCGSLPKIEGFALLPRTWFTMALTTFVSQNLGCKTVWPEEKGARFGVLCSITIAELIGIIIYVAAPVLIAAFNRDPDVVHCGVMQSRTIALFYCLLAFSHCIAAILRGSGNASVPMIAMLMTGVCFA